MSDDQSASDNNPVKSLDDYLAEFPASNDTAAEVFLGGVCNPTVWRFTVAIPALDAAGISYFNPQVKEWHDDLIAKEDWVKENAKVLLFVIDGQTRGIASMVEASEYAARGRPVVLVIHEVPQGSVIGDETIGPNQLKDLNRGRKFLEDVALRHRVPVFHNIPDAVRKVIELVKT